jgi:hypothetical protein
MKYTTYRPTRLFDVLSNDGSHAANALFYARRCAFDEATTQRALTASIVMINEGWMVPAAVVEATDLDDFFDKSNTINQLWTENDEVTLLADPNEVRFSSTSVGDIVKDENGNWFMVEDFGFKDITEIMKELEK